MYAHSVVLNHLISSKQINVVKLEKQMDYPSDSFDSINRVLHIHVYHGFSMFSKFDFKQGKYDTLKLNSNELESDDIRNYALRMALDAKRVSEKDMFLMLLEIIAKKS